MHETGAIQEVCTSMVPDWSAVNSGKMVHVGELIAFIDEFQDAMNIT
jgi:hypothetical protein